MPPPTPSWPPEPWLDHDITCEAAITKLMYLFGLGLDSAEVADHFACSICGELTASS